MNAQKTLTPTEPDLSAFAGDGLGPRLRRLFHATRPKFFPASVLPVLVGTTWGAVTVGQFDWLVFLLALFATVCVHAAANVLNDVGDEISGTDRINTERIFPYTGGSRFIQNGILSLREMTLWGATLIATACLLGVLLVALRGPVVLAFGIAGVALATLYSLPAVHLAARGVGEASVAIAFGVLPVTGAAWLQSGVVDGASVLFSVPVSLWVAAILLINEVPDLNADAAAGKRTLVVRMGRRGAGWLYGVLQVVALGVCLALGWLGQLWWGAGLAALLLLPLALRATRGILDPAQDRQLLTRAIESTLAIHTLGGILLIVGALLTALI